MENRQFYTDLLIVGGGVGGCAAAVTAARLGVRTMIIENTNDMGGLATAGYVNGVAGMNEGFVKEWLGRLSAIGAVIDRPHLPTFDPEKGKLMLERMLIESRVRILYGLNCYGVTMDGSRIKSVLCHSKSGTIEIFCKMAIDGTGDADLSYYAGVPYEIGDPQFCGLNMSTTLAFRMANVNMDKYLAASREWSASHPRGTPSLLISMQEKAVAEGHLASVRVPTALIYQIPGTRSDDADISIMATHSFYTRNLDAEDLTRQIIEQHRDIEIMEVFFREYLPGFERARLTHIANLHGVRDSRRIIGKYILKDSDIAAGSKFDDGVAKFPEFFDTHHPTSRKYGFIRHIHIPEPQGSAICRDPQCDTDMHPFGRPAGIEARVNPREYCEIPYRSLVPEGVDNLLVVGRCVSAEFNAVAAIRIIAPSMSTGQAAGIAAKMCLSECITPAELDGRRVRAAIIASGVPLDEAPSGHWSKMRNTAGTPIVMPSGDFIGLEQPDGTIITHM